MLTFRQRAEIVRRVVLCGENQTLVAREFQVTQGYVSRLCRTTRGDLDRELGSPPTFAPMVRFATSGLRLPTLDEALGALRLHKRGRAYRNMAKLLRVDPGALARACRAIAAGVAPGPNTVLDPHPFGAEDME